MKTLHLAVLSLSLLVAQSGLAAPSADLQKIMTPQASATNAEANAYLFVSTTMNDGQLINLARQARNHGFTVVLNGFGSNDAETQKRILNVNSACCDKSGPEWIVYPQAFRAFKVTAVPAFVIAKGLSGSPDTFSKVTGAMTIPEALGIFANKSALPFVRAIANKKYHNAIPNSKN
ncbi:MAG: hypothetical protein FD131_3228 [Rhodocyclaceae bacterium]|nr:MAG: hypothetical protein FD131_3228 [Rhodocyclaceae bacterium]